MTLEFEVGADIAEVAAQGEHAPPAGARVPRGRARARDRHVVFRGPTDCLAHPEASRPEHGGDRGLSGRAPGARRSTRARSARGQQRPAVPPPPAGGGEAPGPDGAPAPRPRRAEALAFRRRPDRGSAGARPGHFQRQRVRRRRAGAPDRHRPSPTRGQERHAPGRSGWRYGSETRTSPPAITGRESAATSCARSGSSARPTTSPPWSFHAGAGFRCTCATWPTSVSGYRKPDGEVYNFGTRCLAINAVRETGANVLQVMKGIRDGERRAQRRRAEGRGAVPRAGLRRVRVHPVRHGPGEAEHLRGGHPHVPGPAALPAQHPVDVRRIARHSRKHHRDLPAPRSAGAIAERHLPGRSRVRRRHARGQRRRGSREHLPSLPDGGATGGSRRQGHAGGLGRGGGVHAHHARRLHSHPLPQGRGRAALRRHRRGHRLRRRAAPSSSP